MFEKEAEERFVKSYPEFCYNGKPLSPYWDLFSAGIECATDELNKGCIQTLTKENAELKTQIEKMKCCGKRGKLIIGIHK